GHALWSLVLVGTLLAVALGYGVWIGLGPLLGRIEVDAYAGRALQALTTLPMVTAFPVLGVGLGAYGDIYFRYQPPALSPGTLFFEFAHNDLLELLAETGVVGLTIGLVAVWRVSKDLVGAHLLGRGRGPVEGGEGEGARRHDPYSVGLGLGALTGAFALLVHSLVDFAARIPANGMLAAACLGIATVTLHTRFGGDRDRFMAGVLVKPLGAGWIPPAMLGAAVVAVSLVGAVFIARPPLVALALRAAPTALEGADRALGVSPRDLGALQTRARLRFADARRLWDGGQTPDGRILTTWPERQREAVPLLDGAAQDLRTALSVAPTIPSFHEQLGWVHG